MSYRTHISKKLITPIILTLILSTTSLYAQEPFFYVGTRSLSLGKAYVGLANDENALFYNPAGLTQVREQKISISGTIQTYSWEYELFSTTLRPNYSKRGLSAAYIRRGIGISFTILGHGWWDKLTFRDINDLSKRYTVTPVYYQRYITATYAHEIFSDLSLGITGKYVNTTDYHEEFGQGIFEYKHGVTFDIGILYHALDGLLSFGLSMENVVSSRIDYTIADDFGIELLLNELPRNLNFGLAYHPFDNLSIVADIKNLLQDVASGDINGARYIFRRSYHVGCELGVIPELILRAGYFQCYGPKSGTMSLFTPLEYNLYHNVTLGIGFRYRDFQADIGMKADNRKSKMEESPIEVKDPTVTGIVSLSVTF